MICPVAPHVGHLYTLVLTDILKRWHALLGQKSILVTGTDEHGMKVCWRALVISVILVHVVIRSNKQLQRQGKKCERSAMRPTSHSRSGHLGTSGLFLTNWISADPSERSTY